MSGKWPGGFITKNAPEVVGPVDGEGGTASGIWTLDQAADYEKQGLWPKPVLDAELYAWGGNSNGQLGLSDTLSRSSPVQVGALITWSKSAGGNAASIAIKNDGTLWSWGENSVGTLGLNNTTSGIYSPTQVGALTNWSEVHMGGYHCVATKTDGTLWTWGYNNQGQLGQGNTTNRSSPIQVGALTDWLDVAAGFYHSLATKTDGTLWAWGKNSTGQLGQGNTTNYSSPVQVGALTTWLKASAGYTNSCCTTTDGTLFTWGWNNSGRLGLGDSPTNRSSPVQVGALTTWLKASMSYSHSLAAKSDGTLWAWGVGGQGQLGQGNTTNYSSPVQVGALTTWLGIAAGKYFSLSTTSDGKLYAWGNNGEGRLGLGDTTNRSSPVQVGALTTWSTLPKITVAPHSLVISKS